MKAKDFFLVSFESPPLPGPLLRLAPYHFLSLSKSLPHFLGFPPIFQSTPTPLVYISLQDTYQYDDLPWYIKVLLEILFWRAFDNKWLTIPPISTKGTTTSHLKPPYTKMTTHMKLEIQVLAWDRHKNVVGVKPVKGISAPLLIIGPLIAILIYINKHSDDIIHIEDVSSSEWTPQGIVQLYHGKEQVAFDEIIMMSAVY